MTNSGGVTCWGENSNGQLGTGDTTQRTRPTGVSGVTGVSSVTTGLGHTCVLTTSGGVQCWGPGASYRLGNGSLATVLPPSTATPTGLGSGMSAIGNGYVHGCAGNSSTAYCWGYNDSGQIGNGSITVGGVPTPAVVSVIGGISAIAGSFQTTCAVTTSGAAMCWGSNSNGMLGNGSGADSAVPVGVSGLGSGVTAIAVDLLHACALKTGGTVWCWGANGSGQLGDGTTNTRTTPVQAGISGPATAIAVGGQFSCAVVGGGVECWGNNSFGQLGTGATDNDPHSTPGAVSLSLGGEQAQSVTSGHYTSCVLTNLGKLWCWGGNISGELGNGTSPSPGVYAPTPVAVSFPALTSNAVSAIAAATATANGNATSDGTLTITARGACWSTSANPGLTDNCAAGAGGGLGAFTAAMTGLAAGTLYHVRPYVTNAQGTFFGDDTSFTTLVTTPTVTTTAISSITASGAASGGTITTDGGATVTARGVCWATTANPTTGATCTTDGSGAGAFVSTITGLNISTTYHVRAYATNSAGTNYGGDVSFTTVTTATITTTTVTGITATAAASGGTISSDGGAAVTARGVCWAVTVNPTTSATCTSDGSGAGAYASALTGLTAGTTYHARAYATNSIGTAYGADQAFTTATTPTITTRTPSAISGTGATSGGDISTDGGAAVTSRGVCWNTTANPTTASSCSSDGSGAGGFGSTISALSVGTTYHVRAYAMNAVGTSYGADLSFTTNTTTTPPPVFSDDPLSVTATIAAAHLTEMRQAVASLRARYQLSVMTWTDNTITAGVTVIKAIHLTEIRTALNDVYVAAGRTAPAYTNTTVTAGATRITVVDVAELRRAILAIW